MFIINIKKAKIVQNESIIFIYFVFKYILRISHVINIYLFCAILYHSFSLSVITMASGCATS